MAGKISKFIDFAQASGGLSCTNNLYVIGERAIYIRAGIDDAAGSPKTPCIELKYDNPESNPTEGPIVNIYAETNQQGMTSYIRPRADAGSGTMPIAVCSGLFYGVMTTALSGIPVDTGGLGIVPWGASYNNGDVHFAHDPSDAAHNTHVTVLLDGWYTITYTVGFYKTGGGAYVTAYAFCRLNDTIILAGSQTLSPVLLINTGSSASWTGTVYLHAGDNITVACRELNTAANNVSAAGGYCALRIKYEGPS